MSISRNLSVPFSVNPADAGRWSGTYATIYRTIADSTNRLYFYKSTPSPDTIWLDLFKLDFSAGARVKELPTSDNKIRVADVSGEFWTLSCSHSCPSSRRFSVASGADTPAHTAARRISRRRDVSVSCGVTPIPHFRSACLCVSKFR